MPRLLNPFTWLGALTLFGAFKLYGGTLWLAYWIGLAPSIIGKFAWLVWADFWHQFWQ